jgi:hypothetical protein
VHVAYSSALITVALDDNDITIPSFLMIDSPQNAIGQGPSGVRLSQGIYERLINIADAAGCPIQLVNGHLPTLLDELQACLAGHFDVEHSTFQFEPASHTAHEHAAHA